jgi:hypothetical protein
MNWLELIVVAPLAFLIGLFAGLRLCGRYRIVKRKDESDD